MRVFVTGATGFIGEAVLDELKGAGHEVLGLARNDQNAQALQARGVAVHRGELSDIDSLVAGAKACDGVMHLAFIHDFERFMENIQIDRSAVEAMTAALAGTGKPFILTSGTAVAAPGRAVTEDDPAGGGAGSLRGETEHVVTGAAGVRGVVIRLPQVHDVGDKHGLISWLVDNSQKLGFAPYVGDGTNRWPAAHRKDVARLYRLALEKAPAGQRLHAVGEEGVSQRAIAEVIGEGLGVPLKSLTVAEAIQHLGFLGALSSVDLVASSAITRRLMGWEPVGRGLLEDLRTHSAFRR